VAEWLPERLIEDQGQHRPLRRIGHEPPRQRDQLSDQRTGKLWQGLHVHALILRSRKMRFTGDSISTDSGAALMSVNATIESVPRM